MHSIKYLLFLFISFEICAFEELVTKQSLNNIRYISKKGNITYYQNSSGALKLSSNYDVKEIIKFRKGTQFTVSASDDEQWLSVERKYRPHRKLVIPETNTLYYGKFKGSKLSKVGKGVNLEFQNDNKFLTFFNTKTREINVLKNGETEPLAKIKIVDKSNFLFIPQVFMPTASDVVYTDINSKGISAIIIYSLPLKKFETIYKAKVPGHKLEVCYQGDHLIVGDFARTGLENSSHILKIDLYNNPDYIKTKVIYTSPITDIGNMVCRDKNLYFIKSTNFDEELNTPKTEIAKLNLDTEKLEILSNLGDITQLMLFGSYILAPYRGKYLIIKGPKQLVDDSLKKVVP